MLITRNRSCLWNRIAAWLIVPSALSFNLASAQGPPPAPAVQEIPMRPMDDTVPPPPPDGVVQDAAPGVLPASPAARAATGGCGPGAADCQADNIVCTPKGATGGCGPVGTCRVSDTCGNGLSCPTSGCQSGMARVTGLCSDGTCRDGYGFPSNGTACMGSPGSCLSPEVCMGRPYTVGDLNRSIFGAKCRCKEILGLDGCSVGCSPLSQWWAEQQYKSQCRRAYRNHVLSAHLHNKFNYFSPSGCCGEGCPPFGNYARVYATEPHYADARDSQVYASPTTGMPMAVPLPPNVRHQYNYSWGMPSSRLTPISNVVLPRRHR